MDLSAIAVRAAIGIGGAVAVSAGKSAVDFTSVLMEKFRAPDASDLDAVKAEQIRDEEPTVSAFRQFLSTIGVDFEAAVEIDAGAEEPIKVESNKLESWQKTSIKNWLFSNPVLGSKQASFS